MQPAKKYKYRYDIALAIIIILFIAFFVLLKNDFGVLSDREQFQEFIKGFGSLAPLVIILIIIIEVIIAPIPGFVPIISAGFIFGTIEGSIYTLIGSIVGSVIVFLLVRKFGRYIVLRFVNEEKLNEYERAVGRRENILLAFYFIPIFPTDIISIAFGLSNIKFKKFIIFVSLGFVVNVFILNYFGDYLARLYF
ncbi:MAG TPA: DedA family protein [Candidatus Moranbacteria bacterium]|nr:DedA family protein [Candidatus Moranbacteria bacterium]